MVSNTLVTKKKKDVGYSYHQFHKKAWDLFPSLCPFGTMAVVTTKEPIQSKLDQKGTPMIYVGPALSHAKDVFRFLNPTTLKFIESRDVVWMSQMYGDWKGLSPPEGKVFISSVPPEGMQEDEPDPAPSSGSEPPVAPDVPVPPPAPAAKIPRAVRALQTTYNPVTVDTNEPQRTRSQTTVRDPVPPNGREPPERPASNDDTMLRAPAEANPTGREESKDAKESKDAAQNENVQAEAIPWQEQFQLIPPPPPMGQDSKRKITVLIFLIFVNS